MDKLIAKLPTWILLFFFITGLATIYGFIFYIGTILFGPISNGWGIYVGIMMGPYGGHLLGIFQDMVDDIKRKNTRIKETYVLFDPDDYR